MTSWKWTPQREQAAALVADDELTDAAICAKVGISSNTLKNWKYQQPFQERVLALRQDYREALRQRGIQHRERRILVLDDLFERLTQIREERAADALDPNSLAFGVPGAGTGLLIPRMFRTRDGLILGGWVVDRALLRSMCAILVQVAKDLGEWGHADRQAEHEPVPVRVVYGDDVIRSFPPAWRNALPVLSPEEEEALFRVVEEEAERGELVA